MLIATPRRLLLNCEVNANVVLAFVTAIAVLRDEAAADVNSLAAAISLVNEDMLLIACRVDSTMEILLL